MNATIARATTTFAVAAAFTTAAMLGTTTAHADADTIEEIAFVDALDESGIAYSSEDNAIALGDAVCAALDVGVAPLAAARKISSGGGYNTYDSQFIVGASIGAFCPVHIDAVLGS